MSTWLIAPARGIPSGAPEGRVRGSAAKSISLWAGMPIAVASVGR